MVKIKMPNKRHEYDAKLADERIKFCIKCSMCWETPKSRKEKTYLKPSYYQSFPSYGKPREMCPQCKRENTQ